MTAKVLVVAAHPAEHISRVNRAMADSARTLPFVTFRPLYRTYPDFFIEPRIEQAQLLAHDVIVLQHPLYWYSVPSLLKEWIDLTLEHGWAYGKGGTQLVGKTWSHAISAGGSFEAYGPGGVNRYPLVDYLLPLEQTAKLCGMHWHEPFVTHGARELPDDDLRIETDRYRDWLASLAGTHDASAELLATRG